MADLKETYYGLKEIADSKNDSVCECLRCKKIAENALEVIEEAYTTIGRCYSKIDKLLEAKHSKKGHWKGDDSGYKCSICGFCMCEMAHSIDYVTYEKTNFCSNCGADMREGQ